MEHNLGLEPRHPLYESGVLPLYESCLNGCAPRIRTETFSVNSGKPCLIGPEHNKMVERVGIEPTRGYKAPVGLQPTAFPVCHHSIITYLRNFCTTRTNKDLMRFRIAMPAIIAHAIKPTCAIVLINASVCFCCASACSSGVNSCFGGG